MGYMVGHVLGDFFGHPVAIDALRCDDQSEVHHLLEVQGGDVIDQHLGLSRPHLHKITVGPAVLAHGQGVVLMLVWFSLEEVY